MYVVKLQLCSFRILFSGLAQPSRKHFFTSKGHKWYSKYWREPLGIEIAQKKLKHAEYMLQET